MRVKKEKEVEETVEGRTRWGGDGRRRGGRREGRRGRGEEIGRRRRRCREVGEEIKEGEGD